MIVLYARVSTVEQSIEHQLAQATQAGFKIDTVVADNGVSGVSTRLAERTEGRRLFDMLRAGDALVVRWVDRLGRNYADVCDTIREFMRRGVVIKTVINGMTFDGATTDPMQCAVRDALIAFLAATAQAQAEATKAAQRAGIDHKRSAAPQAYLGRKPSYTRSRPVCSIERQRPQPLDHSPRRGPDQTDRLPHQGRPDGRRGRVGCVGLVTGESACASRRHALDFATRFFEPLSVDPKSETLPNSI
jgi:putative DNA-invertase from lambdoid prophage Rac